MKKLQSILISTRTMAVLLLVFAFAMAYATFVENDYGTPAAKALVYESKWFEIIMLVLIMNFIGNIARYRLLRKEKWPVLIFHLSFILLFVGGAITRYISYEGQMHIREGQTSNEIVTDKNFFKIQIEEKGDVLNYQDIPYMMIPDGAKKNTIIGRITPHNFSATYDYHSKKIVVNQVGYLQRKKDSLITDKNGVEYLHFVSAGESGRENYYLKSGETKSIGGILITYNRPIEGAVEFSNQNGNLFIKTPQDATFMTMATQATGTTAKNQYQPLAMRSLYTIGDLRIVVPEGLRKGRLLAIEGDKKKDQNLPDQLTVEVTTPHAKKLVDLSVERGNPNAFKQIQIDGMNMMLAFGPKIYNTPFAIKLDDFIMETYPGSSSPSAYESHISLIENGKQIAHKIFMNHILDHEGYRFFQSGFDPDRGGTILAVNHDYWGTLITYIGYFFLFAGMFVIFFWKGTHFWKLNSMLKQVNRKKTAAVLLILLSISLNAQKIESHGTNDGSGVHAHQEGIMMGATPNNAHTEPAVSAQPLQTMREISADEIIARNKISEKHAEKFGYLLVQNFEGRIVPVNTQAIDVLRKLYKHDKFYGSDGKSLTADQWFLSVNTDTPSWTMVPMIRVGSKGGEELRKKTKASTKDEKSLGDEYYTSLLNLFWTDSNGGFHYVLEDDYSTAFRKKVSEQTNYDKEVIAVNERVQIFNEFFSGQFMRIVPVKNDPNHRWNSWLNEKLEPDTETQNVMGPYFAEVLAAQQSGNWSKADAQLQKLSDYQQEWGKSVVPSKTKVDLEVFLNKVNINFKLLIFYSLIGGLVVVLGFVELFRPGKIVSRSIKAVLALGCVGYILQFFGLVARWYISGHAPWSNGYEAIIFISWVGITAGLILYRNSNALIPAAGFMVAVIMMGFAHGGSALDPQITPLVPVLKSYWLVVHVAIITSSYGFFGLSFVIGIICLLFYIITSKKQYELHNDTTIKELTLVSEMSLTIGLYALTVGTFMGGIWANESWGRYWSWDPKETWAFISVMVYAFVVHMRLVPGLRGRWMFHTVAMFAISSVIMTYFGVNYYLSGLHSYAKGDPVPVPIWVYAGLAGMLLLSVLAAVKYKKLNHGKLL